MNIIRKMSCFAVVLLFSAIVAPSALAVDENTYTIDDLYMQISVPTEYYVFTRNMSADDPSLEWLGMDEEALEEILEEQGIYLSSYSSDGTYEIAVVLVEDESTQKTFKFNLYDDDFKQDAIDGIAQEYMDMDYTVLESSLYEGSQTDYVVTSLEQNAEDPPIFTRQYYTVYNGLGISINLHSYNGAITAAQEDVQQDIVDSIVFTQTLPAPEDTYAAELEDQPLIAPGTYLYNGLIGAGIGALVGLIVVLIRKARKRKNTY